MGLERAGLEISVECMAQVGSRLEDYRKLIEEGQVDLLVMHAKEDDQLAMHGMAHPLAVELRSVPIFYYEYITEFLASSSAHSVSPGVTYIFLDCWSV